MSKPSRSGPAHTQKSPRSVNLDAKERERRIEALRKQLSKARQGLRWYHQLGQQLRTLHPEERAGYGEETIRALARKLQVSHSLLYRAWRFAQLYTPAEVAERDEHGFPWHSPFPLLRISDPGQRREIQQRAIKE